MRLSHILLASTALTGVATASGALHAQSLPTGASVVSGSVGFQRSSGTLTINQSSQNAIVNYNGFSIGANNTVNINQPNASSAILNRVTGNTPSTIAGRLNANGQVYLVNPNGIAITKSGTVKVGGGFVASTLGMSDEEFKNGHKTFKGNGASATVSNAGTISIGRGGYAALIGGEVKNSGLIAVPLGKVGLGSGEVATLDVSGDGFLQVAVPTAADAKGALVSNSGTISAAGGTVVLDAATARAAARNAVNISGTIDAHSIGGHSGAIEIGGGEGGAVKVSGTLNATSRHGKGGVITVTGQTVALKGAHVDASGAKGGGTIRIGGDRHGSGTLQQADTLSVDAKTVIKADATKSGDGGNIVLWSNQTTSFAGLISAQGGASGGNGGFVEVSSHGVLNYTGLTTSLAPKGKAGTLLLDPYNVVISNGTDTGGSFDGLTPTSSYSASGTSVISTATLQSQLAQGNVTITTSGPGSDAGNITVAAPLSWTAGTLLTLTADNNIAVNAPITFGGAAGAGLTLNATNAITVNAPITVTDTGAVTLSYNATSPTNLSFGLSASGFAGSLTFANASGASSLTINSAAYTLLYSMSDVQGMSTGLSGNYALAQNLDASSTTGFTPIGPDAFHVFVGSFNGLGHTISNLTIVSTNDRAAGLFGYVGDGMGAIGVITNVGLVGGSVTDSQVLAAVGPLIGEFDGGTIAQSYATGLVSASNIGGGLVGSSARGTVVTQSYASGAVSGLTGSTVVGGLAGSNGGLITQSYATGSVRGGDAGGLVGGNGGQINQSYATGSVSSVGSFAGGLVGYNFGTVTQAYATGAVTDTAINPRVGGLTGQNDGSVSQSYWDRQTTGQQSSTGGGSGNDSGTGYTTRQLQGLDPVSGSGSTAVYFSTAASFGDGTVSPFSGGANGLYPYLASFYPNGVQAISGLAYADGGATPAAPNANGVTTVTALVDGNIVGSAVPGANGYYYITATAGSVGSGGTLLTYATGNGPSAAALTTATGVFNQSGVNLFGGAVTIPTSATSLSALGGFTVAQQAAQQSALAADGGNTAAAAAINGASGLGLRTSGASFTVDQAVTTNATFAVSTAQGAALTVANPITIGNNGSLGLLSGGTLAINAPIALNGAATAGLSFDASSPTNLAFAQGASITFADSSGNATTSAVTGQALAINGTAYSLLYSMNDVMAVNNKLSGAYALAGDVYATDNGMATGSRSTNYSDAIISGQGAVQFSGTLEGLGHAINALTIASSTPNAGFIGAVASGGTIRDIGVVGGSVSGVNYVGDLVGINYGTIIGSHATGNVSGSIAVGGLAGLNYGTISGSYATGTVIASSSWGGGLVGLSSGTITQAYATGTVSSNSWGGGLAGESTGTVTQSYATGITSGQNWTGGLIGQNNGSIIQSYATGVVRGSNWAGGLVGTNFNGGTISQSYAMGAVFGATSVGGLVGENDGGIAQSFATGSVVSSGGSFVGGVVGYNTGTVTQTYWDMQTTGQQIGLGSGSPSVHGDVTGLTTASFQSGGASGLGAAFAGGTSGLYPYLASFYPNGAQALSGTVYADPGVTLAGSTGSIPQFVYVDIGGTQSLVTTGANGYYYLLQPASNSGQAALAYTLNGNLVGPVYGARLGTVTGTTQNFDVWGQTLIAPTTATRLTAAPTTITDLLADGNGVQTNNVTLAAAAGGDTAAISGVPNLSFVGYQPVGTQGFTIDRGVSPDGLYVQTTQGAINVTAPQILGDAFTLTLISATALNIQAPITANGAVQINLSYDASAPANLSFAGGGSLTFANSGGMPATGPVTGQALTINGQSFGLLYSMNDVQSVSLGGRYALANNLYATNDGTATGTSTVYADAVVAGASGAQPFTGTLEGLGHTIGNLTINSTGKNGVGLIGTLGSGGAVRDIGLVGSTVTSDGSATGSLVGNNNGMVAGASVTGTVSGANDAGGLVGSNAGTIVQSYAAAGVTGSSGVGGLVGTSTGTITQAYATGAARGSSDVGGLVGSNGGAITQAYAMGAVSGTSAVGGLVGLNASTVSQSYSTGAVAGTTDVGGLVGGNVGAGLITQSYWNVTTSGVSSAGIGRDTSSQTSSLMGLTTAQLQSGQATDLGVSFAGGASGLYPYLASFFPNGVQVVSGLAYADGGQTPLASPTLGNGLSASRDAGLVSVAAGGVNLGTSSTGADGSYYVLLPAGTLSAGTRVVAYTNADAGPNGSGAQKAATYIDAADPTATPITSANVYGGWQYDTATSATRLTTLNTMEAATGGGFAPTGMANREIDFIGSSFSINTALSLPGTLVLNGGTRVTQTAAISADSLLLEGGGSFSLTRSNAVGTVAADSVEVSLTTSGATTVGTLTDLANVSTAGLSGLIGITLTTGGSQTLNAAVTSGFGAVTLVADGSFTNTVGANAVTAGSGFTIYTQDSTHPTTVLPVNTFDGLVATNWYNDAFNFGTGRFASSVPSGNSFVYGYAATLAPVLGGSASKAYDRTTTAPTGNLTLTTGTLLNANGISDSAGVTFTGATYDTADAGTSKVVTATGVSLTTNPNNYKLPTLPITASIGTIDPIALTITAADQSKTYGQTASLGTTAFSENGLLNGDTLTGVTLTSAGSAATAPVGSGSYAIRASSAQGSGLGNYTISYVNGALAVSPATLTITASNQSKTYGQTANLGTTAFTQTGLLNNDAIAGVTLTSAGATGTAQVGSGSYAINASNAQGTGLANYTISYVGGALAVSPAALTITASNQSKTYGQALNLGTTAFTETGLVNNDAISGVTLTSAGSGATAQVGSGSYAINASNAQGSGLGNYTISYVGGTLAVNPAALTITASNQSKTYGQTASLGTTAYSEAGLVNGDMIGGVTLTSAGSAGTAQVGSGSYAINASNAQGGGLGNYAISYVSGALAVSPAALTITASNQSKTYGQTANLGTTAFTETGLVNGDAISGVTLTSAGSAATATVAGGPYAISISNAQGNGLANYTISYVNSTLTVAPVALTITASNQSKTYGQALNLGTTAFTETGLVNNDAISGVTLTSAGSTATAQVGSGAYAINVSNAQGSGLGNYTINYVGGTLAVNPAALTITASNQSKTYGQAISLGTTAFTETGLVNGDTIGGVTLASAGSAATAQVGSGSYAINASNGQGSGLANYTISYVGGTLTVNPAALTITASNQTKTYGQTANLGTIAFTETGLVNGDTIGGVTLTSAGSLGTATVAGGPYAINISNAQGSGLNNYAISYVNGMLAVNPAALTITASNQSKVSGQAILLGTTAFTEAGLVNGDTITNVTLTSDGSAANAPASGSPYAIVASGAQGSGLGNYAITYKSGALILTAPSTTASSTIVDATRTIGDWPSAQPVPIFAFGGFGGNGSDGVDGVSDPRFEQTVVCAKGVCMVVTKPKSQAGARH